LKRTVTTEGDLGMLPGLRPGIGTAPAMLDTIAYQPATLAQCASWTFVALLAIRTGQGTDMTQLRSFKALAASVATTIIVAACGGGSGSGDSTTAAGAMSTSTSISSGAITAFGSVFVNGHEYSTTAAKVVDDDTGEVLSAADALEVGMVVDVMARASGSADAAELHLHPLARGVVDVTDPVAGTMAVLGQSVQVTSATSFSDHRACLNAATNPCTAITGQAALSATTGSGAGVVAGTYVIVHGYLFGTGTGTNNIVATLVSVRDLPTGTSLANFKTEGVVASVGTGSITIGGLAVDLSQATCRAAGATVACGSAFSAGQVVSAYAAAAPALPATTLLPDVARVAAKAVVETAGATVEIEGKVSAVTASPASFVLRGVKVDASGLAAGTALPFVGDIVRVGGTVTTGGQGITATSLAVLRAAASHTYGFEANASAVAAGTATGTFTFSVLGQTITVNAATRLADRQSWKWAHVDPATNPFNITTFQTYFAGSTSKHVLVKATSDTGGALTATQFVILPASMAAIMGGPVDATPAPVNSATTGTPSTFSIHGVAVSADPKSIFQRDFRLRPSTTAVTIAAGDVVVVRGTPAAGTITVGATPSVDNAVVDLGVLRDYDQCGM
jgi:hypothetical protein